MRKPRITVGITHRGDRNHARERRTPITEKETPMARATKKAAPKKAVRKPAARKTKTKVVASVKRAGAARRKTTARKARKA
jgi:hypothetical protein